MKRALWCVHALKVLLEVLSRQVRCQGDHFLDAFRSYVSIRSHVPRCDTAERLTRILSVLWAHIFITSVQNVLVHERRTWGDLAEKRNLDRLANLDLLALLHKDLPGEFASIFAVEGGNTVSLRMIALLEGLQGGHKVVSTSDSVGDDTLGDAGCDGALDDSGNGVHGADDLGLELRRNMELDLLE